MREALRHLHHRIARLERTASYPPANETPADRQGKITHLLRIILANTPSLSEFELKFIDDMGRLLNRRRGLEPSTALTEKQARTLRQMIYRKYNEYKHAVPPLPGGMGFEDEVKRLLKSQANPNELRNDKIKKAEEILKAFLRSEGVDDRSFKYKSIDGELVTFSVTVYSYDDEALRNMDHVVDLTTGRVIVLR